MPGAEALTPQFCRDYGIREPPATEEEGEQRVRVFQG